MIKRLKDVLPREAVFSGGYLDDEFQKYLDYEVLETIEDRDPRFPFKYKNIYVWWLLKGNIGVGWNENPSIGWSFPVAKIENKK
jgi:hypothetical protein